MFVLHNITLFNFRSYLGTHYFEFPTRPGLYFLAGMNRVQSSLGANGAGKSTFLDAITWVLFGRTTRGLKANEVLSWGTTSAAVTLEVTIGDRKAQIKRTQKPNSLLLDDKIVDQEELQKFLRLNYEAFKYSVLNAQFTSSFFALQSTEKLSLFSDIMDLNFWLNKSEEALVLTTKLKIKIDESIATINRHNGQIITITGDVQDLFEVSRNFETDRAFRIETLKQEIVDIHTEIKTSRKDIEKIKLRKSKSISNLKTLMTELAELESAREVKLRIIEVMSLKHKELEIGKTNIRHTMDHKHTGYCNVCAQSISPEYAARLKREATSDLVDLEVKQVDVGRQKIETTEQIAKLRLKISRKENECTELRSTISNLDIKYTKTESILSTFKHRFDNITNRLNEAEMGKNPYDDMLVVKQTRLKELKKALQNVSDSKDKLESDYEATKFWIKGFKRVRLFIIEQAFETLEIEVNNTLTQLGMVDWQITFDVERENKSGGITKGFVVFITGPKNSDPVKWESWSGGETQRLQLAGDLGLANLIMQRAGLNNTIEFFDEPSTHLSPEGMLDLANMLHERALEEEKCIWIADHASITNFGEFEGIITAEKDKNGSSITQ